MEMAAMLKDFEKAGPLTLGLNGNEANILCRLHGLDPAAPEATEVETLAQARFLRQCLGITRVLIHRIPFAVSSEDGIECMQPGPFCPNPKKSTGAGDRFNAGVSLGLGLGFTASDFLALGCAVSGFFVRNARSASHHELCNFLRDWADGSVLKEQH
jgi:sugar/nucleoside kinase (ribokinase family)